VEASDCAALGVSGLIALVDLASSARQPNNQAVAADADAILAHGVDAGHEVKS
jgi:hypothetical protein